MALEAVAQVVERFLMHAARIEVFGVRAERERALAELIEAFVHLNASGLRARRPRPQLALRDRGDRGGEPLGVMPDLAGRMFRHQGHANRAHAETLQGTQFE